MPLSDDDEDYERAEMERRMGIISGWVNRPQSQNPIIRMMATTDAGDANEQEAIGQNLEIMRKIAKKRMAQKKSALMMKQMR